MSKYFKVERKFGWFGGYFTVDGKRVKDIRKAKVNGTIYKVRKAKIHGADDDMGKTYTWTADEFYLDTNCDIVCKPRSFRELIYDVDIYVKKKWVELVDS